MGTFFSSSGGSGLQYSQAKTETMYYWTCGVTPSGKGYKHAGKACLMAVGSPWLPPQQIVLHKDHGPYAQMFTDASKSPENSRDKLRVLCPRVESEGERTTDRNMQLK